MKYDLTQEEESAAVGFLASRHPAWEWEAFFTFYELPRWKRRVSELCGSLIHLFL